MNFEQLPSGIILPADAQWAKETLDAATEKAEAAPRFDPDAKHDDWQIDRTETEINGFVIRYRPWDGKWEECHVVDFEAYKILSLDTSDNAILFEKAGSVSPTQNMVKSFEEAQRYLHGDIKWDGCSNWHFDIQDDCMIHWCGLEYIHEVNRLFEKMYEIAKEVTGTMEW